VSEALVYLSYAAGLVEGEDHTGGLIGLNDPKGTSMTDIGSFWDITTTGMADDKTTPAHYGIGLTTEEMKNKDSFTSILGNWDFKQTWYYGDGHPLPQLYMGFGGVSPFLPLTNTHDVNYVSDLNAHTHQIKATMMTIFIS